MKKKELKITLKSDLCAGSGYSYAGVVDSDVCYDDCGLPYIPAKRLKGCLREAAENIGLSTVEIENLFGAGGRDSLEKVGFTLSNAYITDYEVIYRELKGMDSSLKTYVSPQSVLEQFTVVKVQTKLTDTGVAQDNSLRFTRAIKQYSPLDIDKEMVFVAEVEVDEAQEKNLGMVVKALRNIGMNRNRGLGSVACVLSDSDKPCEKKAELSEHIDDEDMYVLTYTVRNTAPLVLNVDNDYTTEKYISGQNVLGYFASAYLKEGNLSDDELFADLFLKNRVIFSALYPCDEDMYYPAPSYINRLKKTKQFVNVSKQIPISEAECREMGIEEAYARGNGNQPKKLKGQFVCIKDDGVRLKEVESEIVYHHTKKSKKQDSTDGQLLYSFEAVRAQQLFGGTIIGKGKHIKLLASILEKGNLRFGKSKSAQYGTCVLEKPVTIRKTDASAQTFLKGTRILITLQSDGVFLNDTGYTVRSEEVRELVAKKLGLREVACEDAVYSEVEVRELIGFYGKWNLKRQAIPVVRAGSSFEFVLSEDFSVAEQELYVGERNGEGYGKIAIVANDVEDCRVASAKPITAEVVPVNHAKAICKRLLFREMKEALRNAALQAKASGQNASTIGRISLMLTDSLNQYPDDAALAYENFCERIASIKTKEKKDKIAQLKNTLVCENEILTVNRLKYLRYIEPIIALYKENFKDDDMLEEELVNLWSDYFMHVLLQEKYREKGRKNSYEN